MSLYLTAVVKANSEYREEVAAVVRNMATETRKEASCHLYHLHQGSYDKNLFFYEIWKDKAGLDALNQQPYNQAFGTLADRKLQEKPQIYTTNIL